MSERYCGLVKWSQLWGVIIGIATLIAGLVYFGASNVIANNRMREDGDIRVEQKVDDLKDKLSGDVGTIKADISVIKTILEIKAGKKGE